MGAGPGDPGLLTLRAREVLERAEAVVYDNLVHPQILDWAPASAERVRMGKIGPPARLPQEEITQALIERAKQGAVVVRLKGGDPSVFGRLGEEAVALAEAGIPFEIVPGVTAASGAAAYAGIPLTHRDYAPSRDPGHRSPAQDGGDGPTSTGRPWPGPRAPWSSTWGCKHLREVAESLVAAGRDSDTPGGLGAPRDLAGPGGAHGDPGRHRGDGPGRRTFRPPAVAIVGEVVPLRKQTCMV